ncbi:MAG: enoyl-CoA hydratase [Proteobacteria bacterium]|nr:enoyl-CoA hydratase [Pseudomonadota bacterium]
MTAPVLLVDKADGLAVLTLNRPERLNALSLELRQALFETFAALETDGETRVVILTGAGRAFSAGLDLAELGSGAAIHGRKQPWADTGAAVRSFSGPVIGAINGAAVTGGFEIALCCDMLIASSNARFADTHGRVGLLAGWGLSQRLSRVIGLARAKELSLTGNFLDAATAERWGLVNRVVAPDALLATCRELAAAMLSVAPEFLPLYKRVIDEGYHMDLGEAMAFEARESRAWNDSVSAASIEARRGQIMARGKQQVSD